MWTVIYISQSKDTANRMKELLQSAGMLVKMRAVTQSANENYGCYELLVPESEVEEAHSMMISKVV